jgi:hypothetical protein
MADVAPVRALADLPQLTFEACLAGVIQFGSVMQGQDHAGDFRHQLAGAVGVGAHHDFVRNLVRVHQAIKAPQVGRRGELVGQGATRVAAHGIGGTHQAFGAAAITEVEFTEVVLAERERRVHDQTLRTRARVPPAPRTQLWGLGQEPPGGSGGLQIVQGRAHI